jgi:protein O-GlcNAc transferase
VSADELASPAHIEALLREGHPARAHQALTASLQLAGQDVELLAALVPLCQRLEREADAVAVCDRVLATALDDLHALSARASLNVVRQRFDAALDDYTRLAELAPADAEAHFKCADVLLALGRYEEALAACHRTLELSGTHLRAQVDYGLALAALGRLAEAEDAFERAYALDRHAVSVVLGLPPPPPELPPLRLNALHVYLDRGWWRLMRCDWSDLEGYTDRFARFATEPAGEPIGAEVMPLAYAALALPIPPRVSAQLAQRLAAGFSQRATTSPPRGSMGQRIRVGYVSPDFREHLNAYLIFPLFRLHDRSRFEIFAYALNPDDRSEIGQRIRQSADACIELATLDDLVAAQRIANDGIDVLVDLGGYAENGRPGIMALRPARIQVSYLGFAGTFGADYVGYRITDPIATPPEASSLWSEKLVFLPNTFYPYDNTSDWPSVGVSRRDYGLPENGFVFCCFHEGYKIEPGMFDVWMRLLDAVPRSVLWLRGSNSALVSNLRREAQARGIGGARLVFAPHEDRARYFARFALADLFLDTRLFNAMTTACDALWMGLPLLTCRGGAFPARVGASLLAAAGLPELIALSLEEYEARALQLAREPAALAALRDKVQRTVRASALFDTRERVRELESAYAEMARRERAGLAPESFAVQAVPPRLAWF